LFDFYPPELLVLEMVLNTTNLSFDTAAARQKLRLAKRDLDRELAKHETCEGGNGDPEDMSERRRGEALYEYVLRFYSSDQSLGGGQRDDDTQLLEEAAKEMGVSEVMTRMG
jgi:hypothetical protein